MAIHASLQSASSGVALPAAAQGSLEDNYNKGWANLPEGGCNGWGPPDLKKPEEKSNYGGWADDGQSTHNGWGSSEAGPSMVYVPTNTHSNVSGGVCTAAASVPSAQAELSCTVVSPPNDTPPSAPPLPSEYVPSGTDDSYPIRYPSIDTSPVELNYSLVDLSKSPAIKENADEKAASVCVVCWDSPAEAVCIPCGHLAGCMECISEIKAKQWGCPVCRTTIDQVVKVYTV
ncbi:hypothetical protein O6H91_Y003600 [Diphasiastrum complanatum]|nr:hypothetical protein O6H91_Y003600 [Diphasiastrum complanatum]